MAALPKRRGSQARQGRRRGQLKLKLPQLSRTSSGKLVPAHMVTADNPTYKQTKFIAAKAKKQ